MEHQGIRYRRASPARLRKLPLDSTHPHDVPRLVMYVPHAQCWVMTTSDDNHRCEEISLVLSEHSQLHRSARHDRRGYHRLSSATLRRRTYEEVMVEAEEGLGQSRHFILIDNPEFDQGKIAELRSLSPSNERKLSLGRSL